MTQNAVECDSRSSDYQDSQCRQMIFDDSDFDNDQIFISRLVESQGLDLAELLKFEGKLSKTEQENRRWDDSDEQVIEKNDSMELNLFYVFLS